MVVVDASGEVADALRREGDADRVRVGLLRRELWIASDDLTALVADALWDRAELRGRDPRALALSQSSRRSGACAGIHAHEALLPVRLGVVQLDQRGRADRTIVGVAQ